MSYKVAEPFKTDHGLPFEAAEWPNGKIIDPTWMIFRVGTCHGTWRCTRDAYEILNIENNQRHNGHFNDVFQWFEHSCKRDKRILRIRLVWNINLRTHLLTKRGFKPDGPDDMVKIFM